MIRYAATWGAAFLVISALDAVALTQLIGPFVEARVGGILRDDPVLPAALAFYLLYPAAVVHFAASGRAPAAAARQGALFGLVCYGVYEATNMATISGWTWGMVALDLAWGAFVSAVGAFAAARAAARFGAA
ncbi:DUF2177 family protein [Rhodovulum sp. DZ06]|uniref:DUF2177 family protein n=1 Tax=Rhodovulum sp. DZ06 TaxID=3425126 RepID=UPI003D330C6F